MASFLTVLLLAHSKPILSLVFVAMTRAAVASSLQIISTGPLGQLPIAINSDQVISFNCTVAGGEAAWEIGGHQFLRRDEYRNNGVIINTSDDLLNTTLSISKEGLDILNQTNFSIRIIQLRCFVFNLKIFENMFGSFSYIIRHGAPGPPHGLQLISNSSLVISWKRPSNLPSVVPIQYTVEIRDLLTGYLLQRNNTTELYMDIIHVSVQTKCNPYFMTVVAWNEAGHSIAASITESIPLDPDTSSISQSLDVKELDFHNGQYISFQVSFLRALDCNSNFPVLNHTVVLEGPVGGLVPLTHEDFNSSSSSFTTTSTSNQLHGLRANRVYSVYIIACSSFTCKRSQSVKLRTYHIKSGSVVFKDSDVYLSCVPTDGSNIYGCKFPFPLPNKTDFITINITQDNKEMCYQLHNQREAYTNISVYPVDQYGRVVGVSIIAHVTEDDSRPGCSSTTASSSGDDKTDRLDDGTLAGIVLSVVVLLLVGVSGLAIFILCFRYHKQKIEETDGGVPKVDVSLSPQLVEALKAAARGGSNNLQGLESGKNMKVLLHIVDQSTTC